MSKPRICAVIVDSDINAIKAAEPLVDLFEVRIDLIGAGWRDVVKKIDKPWLACNRSTGEGGKASGKIKEELVEAAAMGADIVDVELNTEKLDEIVALIKKKAKCLISYHDLSSTPTLEELRRIARAQLKAGADICKVVTTAHSLEDNLTVLQLVSELCQKTKIVSFAMGEPGILSRVLSPLAGGYFTYASIERGKESAPGQLTVKKLGEIYGMLKL